MPHPVSSSRSSIMLRWSDNYVNRSENSSHIVHHQRFHPSKGSWDSSSAFQVMATAHGAECNISYVHPYFGGFVRQFWADLADFTVRKIQDFLFFLKTSNFEQPQLFRPWTDFDNFWSVDQLRARSLHFWPFPAHLQKWDIPERPVNIRKSRKSTFTAPTMLHAVILH